MTLSAIDANLALYCPSAEDDSDGAVAAIRIVQKHGLFCPHCYRSTGQLLPVRFRNSQNKRKHFFHVGELLEGQRECAHFNPETERHLNAKKALEGMLFRQYGHTAEILVDIEWLTNAEGTRRKPDILVNFHLGTREAHEIQCSPIAPSLLEQRTVDLKSLHCDRVVWWLFSGHPERVYTSENRRVLSRLGIEFKRFWFDSDGKFCHESGETPRDEPKPSSKSGDSCGSRPNKHPRSDTGKHDYYLRQIPPPVRHIQSGASRQTCQMGGADYKYDDRPYVMALEQEGFRLIQQWLNHRWSEPAIAECIEFLRTAIQRGSFPMLSVAAIAVAGRPELIQELSDREQVKLFGLLRIGGGISEFKKSFAALERGLFRH